MAKFSITTSREMAEAVERTVTDPIAMRLRKVTLIAVNHYPGYSSVAIEYENPEDVFWLGVWTESLKNQMAMV